MSDRLLKESDVLRIAFQLPLVVNSAFADAVKAIPSADRPQGEWIRHKNAEEICGTLISNYECSLCHEWQTLISNFCPSCGARMKGADNDTD